MDYKTAIEEYKPENEQEAADRSVILSCMERYGDRILLRENKVAHVTASGFLMNRGLDKVLLAHHIIMNRWAWSGGHADGETDLLQVAVREAREETGVVTVRPLAEAVASIDILTVSGHRRRGEYVNAHLHLSIAYLLLCDEGEEIRPRPAENTAVAWFPTGYFTAEHFDADDVYLYNKLIKKAKAL